MSSESGYDLYAAAMERAQRFGAADAQCRELLIESDARGCGLASVALGRLCESGAVSSNDVKRALRYFVRADAVGESSGALEAGRLLVCLRRSSEAAQWLAKARAHGHRSAAVWMIVGGIFEGGPEDEFGSLLELADVSEQARVELGFAFLNGHGVTQDRERAREIFLELEMAGNPQAAYGLAWIEAGSDGSPSMVRMRQAADGGAGAACLFCAEELSCNGENRDLDAALGYARRAAAFRVKGAHAVLAGFLLRGWGAERNPEEARRLLEIAAEDGDPHAMFLLSLIYERGDGVAMSASESRAWLRRASSSGSNLASRKLKELDRGS